MSTASPSTILRVCQPIAGLQAEEARSHRAEREKVRDSERARRQRTKRLSSSLRHGGRKPGLVAEKLLPRTPTPSPTDHTRFFSSHDRQAPASVAACQASFNRFTDDFHMHKIYRCIRPRMSSPNAGRPHDKWESKSSVTRGYTVTAERGCVDQQVKTQSPNWVLHRFKSSTREAEAEFL